MMVEDRNQGPQHLLQCKEIYFFSDMKAAANKEPLRLPFAITSTFKINFLFRACSWNTQFKELKVQRSKTLLPLPGTDHNDA